MLGWLRWVGWLNGLRWEENGDYKNNLSGFAPRRVLIYEPERFSPPAAPPPLNLFFTFGVLQGTYRKRATNPARTGGLGKNLPRAAPSTLGPTGNMQLDLGSPSH